MPLYRADDLALNAPSLQPSLVGEGLLPETGCLLLTGRTEAGKSVIALDIAFNLALGAPLFGAKSERGLPLFPVTRPVKVLYLDSELGPSGVHQRLKLFYQAKCEDDRLEDRFQLISGAFDPLLLHTERESNEGFKNLEQLIVRIRPEVLVVDPLSDYHLCDENDNEMRVVFKQLRWLQTHYKFASILIHHETDKDAFTQMGKPIVREGTGKARGHSSITQAVDTMLSVRRERKHPYAFVLASWDKCRHQSRPPRGWLFVDYSQMRVEWLGTERLINATFRDNYCDAYEAAHPLENS